MNDLIKRQDVLDAITKSLEQYGGNYTADMLNMWGLFTQLIKELPSAEPCKVKERDDSLLTADSEDDKESESKLDLISRQDAIDAVGRFRNIDGISVWHNGIKESIRIAIIEDLAKLPSADREDEDRLYIKIYADDEPSRKAEKLYQISGSDKDEVTEWVKEYFPSAETRKLTDEKGVFIPGITVEMLKKASLEGVETLLAEGTMYDVDMSNSADRPTDEEDEIKFYYVESIDDYWIGMRIDNFYYADWHYGLGFVWSHSRYLPWGEHVVDEGTAWKEHTYPSEPVEIPFTEWIIGFVKKYFADRPKGEWKRYKEEDGKVYMSPFSNMWCSECGHEGSLNMNFCQNCGARMKAR